MKTNKEHLKNLLQNLEELFSTKWDHYFDPSEHYSTPKTGEVNNWELFILPKLRKIIEKYNTIYKYLSEDSQKFIIDEFNKIISIYNNLKKNNFNHTHQDSIDFTNNLNSLSKILDYINYYLPTLAEDFAYENESNLTDIIDLLNSDNSIDSYIIEGIADLDRSFKPLALTYLIKFFNDKIQGKNLSINLKELYELIFSQKRIVLLQQKDRLEQESKELDIRKQQELIKIDKAKNAIISNDFKDKANSLKVYIVILNGIIFFLFIIIILIFFRKTFEYSSTPIDIIHSVSFVIAISSLLAFLIKEKNTLSKQYSNYMKCHIELLALSTYLSGITEEKSEDLKISLASKYFTGYISESNDNTSGLTPENINQIILLIKETQKKTNT